jgi:hypothetical protein
MLQKIVPVGGGNDNRKLDHQQLGVTRQVNCLAVVRMGICGPVGNKSGVVAQSAAEQPWPDATAQYGFWIQGLFPDRELSTCWLATDALPRRTTLRP